MVILPGYKLCRKKLHQFPADKKQCPECKKESLRKWREKNSDREKEVNKRWREKNAEHLRENSRNWRKQNPEKYRECVQQWREKNPEKTRISQLRRSQRWREKNREKMREYRQERYKRNPEKRRMEAARRRSKKKQATPAWADNSAIKAIYVEAIRLEQQTGIKHHVDHIYPLNSPYLCGLHVAENLQILSGPENCSKGNWRWPGQLECQRLPLHMNGFEVVS